jgi:hypothetical protein
MTKLLKAASNNYNQPISSEVVWLVGIILPLAGRQAVNEMSEEIIWVDTDLGKVMLVLFGDGEIVEMPPFDMPKPVAEYTYNEAGDAVWLN